jgi:hypothetical protein
MLTRRDVDWDGRLYQNDFSARFGLVPLFPFQCSFIELKIELVNQSILKNNNLFVAYRFY